MKYTNRADLLIAAGESIKMQQNAGCVPMCKCNFNLREIDCLGFAIPSCEIEFPLAVVEGKPVFVGDTLYDKSGVALNVEEVVEGYFCEKGYTQRGFGFSRRISNYSWNPPKPKTVIVELLREDAEKLVKFDSILHMTLGGVETETIAKACRKALEKA